VSLCFGVLGSPIAHSKSPVMHEAAYRALGLPHVYERIETPPEALSSRIDALREGTFAGLNVTLPHKTTVLPLVDALDESARILGAANTLVRADDGVKAYNTDGPALREELALLSGASSFRGRSAIVLGSGGAARAAIFALGSLGVSCIFVRARTERRELETIAKHAGLSMTLRFESLEAAPRPVEDACAIVQTTTAGMVGASAPDSLAVGAIAWEALPADCVVYDVVYAPRRTALVEVATARGFRSSGGLGMLVGQGALAFERWLGIPAPRDVMRAALG
jgi:shikimate dehydrogenase